MEAINQLLQNVTSDSKKECPYCKSPRKALELNFGGIIRTVYPVCKCETEAYEKEKELEQQKEKMRRMETLFKQSRLGERFKKCTFDNFIVRQGTEEVFSITKDYADNFGIYRKDGTGLLLSSIPGTGKTHLTAAITNLLLSKMTSVVFVVVPELMQSIRDTYGNSNETESSIMYGLTECDLLILDDIGAEKKSDWTMEKIFTVIDNRYRNHKPIIFTTNCNSVELKERVGDRTFSRIMEVSKPIKLTCDDYRMRNF